MYQNQKAETESSVTAKPAVADAPKPSRRNTSPDVSKQSKRHNSSPKNKPKQHSDRLPKGAKDPVAMHNKFGALEEMECTPSHSSARARSLSPKKHKGRISHKKS